MRAKFYLLAVAFGSGLVVSAGSVAAAPTNSPPGARAVSSAEQLASQIVEAAKNAEAAARSQGLSEDKVQAAIANAVNAVVLNSGDRPRVVLEALRIAERDFDRSRNTAVLAALITVRAAVDATVIESAGGGAGGGSPLGAPPSAGSGGGGSAYRATP